AGIICSTAEMSAKGGAGMHIDLNKVPMRQNGMKAWELLLSESQERMLLVVEKGREVEAQKVFDKWDLENAVIGHVTDDGLLHFYLDGKLEAQIPAYELVLGGGAPQYERAFCKPKYFEKIEAFDMATISEPMDLKTIAEALIQLSSIASKRWVYHQYDSMVGTVNTSTNAPSDAAIILVKETGKGIAVTVDCNSHFVYADPYKGAMIAVAEAARNIVCSGGQPLGVTNCLNFGNPYDSEVYYQFTQAVQGMGEACRKFDTPVTGGNVSFYNQGPEGAVYPTPTIGMVGLVDDLSKKMTLDFKSEGDEIFLIGSIKNDISSSQYLRNICGIIHSPAPYFNLGEEYQLQQLIAALIKEDLVVSAHDVSEGGLFTTLMESAFHRDLGFEVRTSDGAIRPDAFWFGEAQSRVVVSVSEKRITDFLQTMNNSDVPFASLGKIIAGDVLIDGESWGQISYWKELYDTAIEKYLVNEVGSEGALSMI
ncbi:MAG: AIR synthase-related protein, partial [Bacteroidota bacterium]|nr:AIR synthase-related protein [Bacteroidota bacterium]